MDWVKEQVWKKKRKGLVRRKVVEVKLGKENVALDFDLEKKQNKRHSLFIDFEFVFGIDLDDERFLVLW